MDNITICEKFSCLNIDLRLISPYKQLILNSVKQPVDSMTSCIGECCNRNIS